MKTPLALLLSAALAGGVAGQEEAEPGPAEQIAELKAEFDEARQKFMEAYRAAEDEAAQQRVFEELYPNGKDYADGFLEVARRHPGTDEAKEALVWVVNQGGRDHQATAVELLVHSFADDEAMGDVCWSLMYQESEAATAFLERMVESSPHHDVRGTACYVLGSKRNGAREMRSRLENDATMREQMVEFYGQEHVDRLLSGDLPDGRPLLERVIEEFGDVTDRRGNSLADSAKGDLFEADNLVVGKPAPEIVGSDVDGVEFKLSDYRGKVVFLDFWGHW